MADEKSQENHPAIPVKYTQDAAGAEDKSDRSVRSVGWEHHLNKFLKILWLVIFLALLGGFGHLFYRKLDKLQQLRRQQIRYEKELSLLENKVARLTREIDELTNNPARLEKLARDKLGLAGKNEKIFIIEPTPVGNN